MAFFHAQSSLLCGSTASAEERSSHGDGSIISPTSPSYGGREVQRLTSVIHHPSSVIRHPSSVIRHPSSVIRHPSSVIRHLVFSRCGHGCGLFACIRSCILELSNCTSTSRETKWLAGLSLSKRAREVETNKKLAQGIRQFEKAMIVTS